MNQRYALCVGNNYPGSSAELHGCVNDVLDWGELLGRNGYDVDVMVEAHKTDVLDHLRGLVGKAGFADRIVFQYSGHGTWVPDRDGDEADGRDEALVMAGLSRADLITDDELQQVFAPLKYGTGALILSDSCHSGTVSRFTELPEAAQLNATRFISPIELDTSLSFERVLELEQQPANTPRRTASLISGCADSEYSYDASFNGRPNGAFSRVAIDAFTPGVSLNGWWQRIRDTRSGLPSESYPQTPQLTASSMYRKYTKAL
jgi:hypothetical protein